MAPIEHYADEIERRGEGHVFGCSGIYPTGYDGDGSPRYDGVVCRYGDEDEHVEVVTAETTHIRYVGPGYDVKLPYPVAPELRPAD